MHFLKALNYKLVGHLKMPGFYQINSWFIGMKKTKDLLYTGDSVSAGETERLGIVNWIVPVDELEKVTRAMAVKLSLVPPKVMRLTKQPINRTYELMGLFKALKLMLIIVVCYIQQLF